MSLAGFTQALIARSLEREEERLARETLETERDLLEIESNAKLSLRGQFGARLVPSEKGRALEDASRVVLLPRDFTPTQQHAVTVSKILHDFGRLDAQRRTLEAREKLIPFDRMRAEEQALWDAADLLLGVRAAGAIVASLEPQLANAGRKRDALEQEYRKGLRSQADRTRGDADVLRVELQLERSRRTLRERAIAAAARTGLDADRIETAASSRTAAPLQVRSAEEWRTLLTPPPPPSQAKAPLPGMAATEIERIEAQRGVLRTRLDATRTLDRPTLNGEIGTQWPGEFLPLRGTLFATVTFAWDVPWNGRGALERDRLLVESRALDLADARVRRDAAIALAAARPAREALLRQLSLLDSQRAILESLQALTVKRFGAGRATSLELSTVEDDLLANAAETVRLQGDLASAALAEARARGDRARARSLVP